MQGVHAGLAQHLNQYRVHAGCHAIQAAADVDRRAIIQPCLQSLGLCTQGILHIAMRAAIAREHPVQVGKLATALPVRQFVGMEAVMRLRALTEQQPVA